MAKVAELLGTSTQNLNQKISRGSLKYSEFKKIVEAIGYEIAVKKQSEC